jgi:hypothetical protein
LPSSSNDAAPDREKGCASLNADVAIRLGRRRSDTLITMGEFMLHRLKAVLFAATGFAVLAGCVAAPPPRVVVVQQPERHPAYLHALTDLRAARWLIEHRPGDWAQTADEGESVRQIDAAINDIKKAAFDDGKNINDHPPVDEHPDHRGRIHEALQLMNKARADIAREEDNAFANGLRSRAIEHIEGAIHAARRVFNE